MFTITGVKKIVRYAEVRYIEVPLYNFYRVIEYYLLVKIAYLHRAIRRKRQPIKASSYFVFKIPSVHNQVYTRKFELFCTRSRKGVPLPGSRRMKG